MTEPALEKRNAWVDADDSAVVGTTPVSWIVQALARDRRLVFALAGLGFFVSLVVALLRATSYTSSFSFVPQSATDQSRMGGLASIAGQFGISLGSVAGQGPSPQLYADLLRSREILDAVVNDSVVDANGSRVPLQQFLGIKGGTAPIRQENAVRTLRDRIVTASVAARTSGVVTVMVRTASAQASGAIAQQLLDALNRFNVEKRKSQATEERHFVEARLAEARRTLRSSEDALQQFLQANRQYTGSPELVFQRERLERAVNLQQQVVMGLAQQFEDARIREVRDTPVFTVLEEPNVPALPDPKGRATTVVLGTIIAAIAGIMWALGRMGWERQRELTSGGASDGKRATVPHPTSII